MGEAPRSGALLSVGKLNAALLRTIHGVAPVVLAVAMGVVVYLVGRKT